MDIKSFGRDSLVDSVSMLTENRNRPWPGHPVGQPRDYSGALNLFSISKRSSS